MPINVKCIKCDKEGKLLKRKSKTRDTYYQYYYVKHTKPKVKWCYYGKYDKLPTIYQDLLQATYKRIQQEDTTGYNIIKNVKPLNSTFIDQNNSINNAEVVVPRVRFELTTIRSSAGRSPSLSYLGALELIFKAFI
jgi:hypothetical protein